MFLITIVMCTADGRAVVAAYVEQTTALFVAQLPYSNVGLALMACCALGCLLLLRARKVEAPRERWVWREIRVVHSDSEMRP